VSPANPYVPDNTPAISDLFELFNFAPFEFLTEGREGFVRR
jgi:hypothetical protein